MGAQALDLDRWPVVAAVELVRVALPLLRPHVYAGGVERERQVVLVRAVDADGVEGWGECSALSSVGYLDETTDSAWRALRRELVPAWLGGARPATAAPMAHAAVETAALDLVLRRLDVPLCDAVAGRLGPRRASTPWCAVLGPGAGPDEVEEARRSGAAQIKLKVVGQDVSHVARIRASHPDADLAVDANGCYAEPADVPAALADLGLRYVEQPVPAHDLRAAAAVRDRLGVAVALDESITGTRQLVEAVEAGALDVVNVKAPRLGGALEATRTLEVAAEAGVDAFVGGMLETGVGRALALSLAVQAPCTLPTDAGPTDRYFARDVAPAFAPDDRGALAPAEGPGLGVRPDPEALAHARVDRVLLRA